MKSVRDAPLELNEVNLRHRRSRSCEPSPDGPRITTDWSFVRNFVEEVELEKSLLEDLDERTSFQRDNPGSVPENLLKTTRWYQSWTKRAGPLFRLQRDFFDVLHWKKPVEAVTVLGLWILICLYPALLVALPMIVLLLYIGSNLNYKRTHHQTVTEAWKEEFTNTSKLQRTRNMEDSTWGIQQWCTFVDNSLLEWHPMLDFTDEKRTWMVVKLTMVAAVLMLMLTMIIPLRYLLIGFGVCLSFWFTPTMRALRNILWRTSIQYLQSSMDSSSSSH